MKRTQIQLPDLLYYALKNRAERIEASLAEVIRTAGEYYLQVHPAVQKSDAAWVLPEGEDLGKLLIKPSDFRKAANEPVGDERDAKRVSVRGRRKGK